MLALLLLTACTSDKPATPSATPWAETARAAPPKHLILISVDTLRADHLDDPSLTPFATKLAAEGARFTQATAPAPTTLASHTSLMTGLYPHRHGVPRNGFLIPDDAPMLAARLANEGFVTAAVIGGLPLSARFGFDRGFQHFDEDFDVTGGGCRGPFAVEQSQRGADRVTDAALGWLGAQPDTPERLFLFVHYFDPHAPYRAPQPYRDLHQPASPRVWGSLEERLEVREAWPELADQSQALEGAYAAEVAWTDSQIGRLLDGLDAAGVLDDALVVLTSDHGEAFAEHWEIWNHGLSLYQEAVHVPLIVWGAGRGGQVLEEAVSTVDVRSSAMALLQLDDASGDGVSFAGGLTGGEVQPRWVFSEATKPSTDAVEAGQPWPNAAKCRSARFDDWKYVECPWRESRELYDLHGDPGETRDRLADGERIAAARAEAYAAMLESWAKAGVAPSRFGADAETVEGLKALGYFED